MSNENTGKEDIKNPAVSEQDRYLTFTLGQEQFAIPLLSVREVIAPPEVTPVPFVPPHFMGVFNLRGQVISLIDFRMKMGADSKKKDENAVIICEVEDIQLGLYVDSIDSVLHPSPELLSEPPKLATGSKMQGFITGVYRSEHSLTLLLDIQRLLTSEDRAATAKAKAS